MTPGRTDVGEQSVLCLGDLGFPAAAPCRNKHQSNGKEEIIYLDCQIPTLLTELLVICEGSSAVMLISK